MHFQRETTHQVRQSTHLLLNFGPKCHSMTNIRAATAWSLFVYLDYLWRMLSIQLVSWTHTDTQTHQHKCWTYGRKHTDRQIDRQRDRHALSCTNGTNFPRRICLCLCTRVYCRTCHNILGDPSGEHNSSGE